MGHKLHSQQQFVFYPPVSNQQVLGYDLLGHEELKRLCLQKH